jgi:serine/threonine protein kinase
MSLLSARPQRLGDRYGVEELLGRGGSADVYRAHDDVLDRPVAVKVLRDVRSEERFRAEARTLARLAHPGLVTVLDAGVSDGLPWLVMELVVGSTLADRCRDRPLASAEVSQLGRRVADALAHVHRNGLVHRDVKPGNVLLADDGRVLLTDFGIARLLDGAERLTETGLTMGTAAYLAPEQVRGETLTPAVDVYALGLVLLEALTGRRAFPGATAESALARLTRPPTIPAELPVGWRDLLAAMTALAPADRPSADRVAKELRLLTVTSAAAPPTVPLRTGPAPTRALTVPVAASRTTQEPTPPARPRLGARSLARLDRVRHSVVPRWRVPGRPARLGWLAAGLVVLLVVLVVAGLASRGGTGAPARPTVPSGVPSQVGDDLQQLHDAVAGR